MRVGLGVVDMTVDDGFSKTLACDSKGSGVPSLSMIGCFFPLFPTLIPMPGHLALKAGLGNLGGAG